MLRQAISFAERAVSMDVGIRGTAEVRGAAVGKDGSMEMLPRDCSLSDYQRCDGMLVPTTGEAAWLRPEGRRAHFVGPVKALRYAFLQ